MTLAYLIGLTFGAGLLLLVSAFRPAPAPLSGALGRLHRSTEVVETSFVTRRFGSSWESTPLGRRLVVGAGADLALCGTTPAEYLAQRLAISMIAMLWAPLTVLLISAAGISVPIVVPVWASLALAPVGFVYPALSLRSKAAAKRRAFRHAFSSFLDVVAVSLAGGKGVEGALNDGAEVGHGWAFDELRQALMEARLMGETPWAGLARLGERLEIPEIQELAASAALAGAEGARVRMSVAAKARALRLRGLADIEAAAQSASERMSLPVVALMMGFVVFLGYPAVMSVVRGL